MKLAVVVAFSAVSKPRQPLLAPAAVQAALDSVPKPSAKKLAKYGCGSKLPPSESGSFVVSRNLIPKVIAAVSVAPTLGVSDVSESEARISADVRELPDGIGKFWCVIDTVDVKNPVGTVTGTPELLMIKPLWGLALPQCSCVFPALRTGLAPPPVGKIDPGTNVAVSVTVHEVTTGDACATPLQSASAAIAVRD